MSPVNSSSSSSNVIWRKERDPYRGKEVWIKIFRERVRIQETYSVNVHGQVGDFINRIYLIEPIVRVIDKAGFSSHDEAQSAIDILLYVARSGIFTDRDVSQEINKYTL